MCSSFPVLLVFMSMIAIALLSNPALNPLSSPSFTRMNSLVRCRCSAWKLHLLQFDWFTESMFLKRKPISMHNHNTAVARLLTFFVIFYNTLENPSALSLIFKLFWRADGILMNSIEDILTQSLSSCNRDINCQAGSLGNCNNCYSLEAR